MPAPQSLQSSGLTLSETSMGRCVQGQRRVCSPTACSWFITMQGGFYFFLFYLNILFAGGRFSCIFLLFNSTQNSPCSPHAPSLLPSAQARSAAPLQVRLRWVTTSAWMFWLWRGGTLAGCSAASETVGTVQCCRGKMCVLRGVQKKSRSSSADVLAAECLLLLSSIWFHATQFALDLFVNVLVMKRLVL